MADRLNELGDCVLGSRPKTHDGHRFNEGFVLTIDGGYSPIHTKYYLPNEPGFWEASWYERSANGEFATAKAGEVEAGMMICTDMWFTKHARRFGKDGAAPYRPVGRFAVLPGVPCHLATPFSVALWVALFELGAQAKNH